MKSNETKIAFVKARAEGKSYGTISKEIGIAKATCQSWERELRADIEALRRERMEEIYTEYGMTREARIKTLGATLQKLDAAIAERPLEEIPTAKLLELRLKYAQELKTEYEEPAADNADDTLQGIIEDLNRLYSEAAAGRISPAGVKARLDVLTAKKETMYALAKAQGEEEDPLGIAELLCGNTLENRLLRRTETA